MSRSTRKGIAFCLCLTIVFLVMAAVNAHGKEKADHVASPPDRTSIGCILPLTGQYAAHGNRALDAILLATGVFAPGKKSPYKLFIEDSCGKPERAKEAVIRLVTEGRVMAILGPLGGAEALAAAEEAQRLAVPIITLTQKEGVTAAGSYVFRYSLSLLAQIRTLVRYAIFERGLHSFAILHPLDNYGQEMAKLFQQEVLSGGGEIRYILSYDKAETDFSLQIRELAGLPLPAEEEEGTGEEGATQGQNPHMDFTALFIPDTSARVGLIAAQLAFHGIEGVQLLGVSGLRLPEPLPDNSEYLEGAVFVDGFVPDSTDPAVNDFGDTFYAEYNREPETMEALVYDATVMSMRIMSGNQVNRRDRFRDALARVKDYRGVTGETSFVAGRDAQKDAFVCIVKNGRIVQIR